LDIRIIGADGHQETPHHEVSVEVIIPALNEEQTVGELIDEINRLDLPLKVSVLVIDGGSTDNTINICKSKNVKVIVQKGKGFTFINIKSSVLAILIPSFRGCSFVTEPFLIP
jgi:cellulose synthase/poly-beta-1,6-N-acetylglucosamine synthase-like glycosyltransferase